MSDACDVVLGLSGGVDSSLACAMLLEQGLRPLAVTFRFQPCDDDAAGSCCGAGAVRLAARVAARLGVEHRVVDLRAEFERLVLARAWQQYAAGRTPNPCVDCNRLLRFPALARLADELGAPWLATGHHARLRPGTEGAGLLRGADTGKDQSYFLYGVEPALLARCRFPVGGLHKEEVRRRAAALGLETAGRPDSQDLCLDHQGLGPGELLRLRFRGERRPGEIVDEQGRPLNPSLVDYRIMRAVDVPKEIHGDIVETPLEDGPWGARGVGEHVMVQTAPAIANAINDALGIRFSDLPLSAEKVFLALQR